MTKLTDRVSDSAIVELAKQQYESKQKNKVPTQLVYLTSKGLVYPESHPLRKGYVHMRNMTAYDEDIITNESYIKEGIMFDILLAELITDDIDINDIALIDKDKLIIDARILGYGSDYQVIVVDPKTKNPIERTVKLADLVVTDFNLTPDENGEFEYTVNDNYLIKFKFKNATDDAKVDKNRIISSFLLSTIVEVNGDRNKSVIEHFIKYIFSPLESRNFRKYYSGNSPELVMDKIEFEGEDGDTFIAGFQPGADLFWI